MTTWTRSEVKTKLATVLDAGQIDTFMHGCGGDESEPIGYKELDATVAEILGANYDLASQVMAAFGFEYKGKSIPMAEDTLKESIFEKIDEDIRSIEG